MFCVSALLAVFFNTRNGIEYTKDILERYFEPEDWDCTRFSNNVYFGSSLQYQLGIIEKSGE